MIWTCWNILKLILCFSNVTFLFEVQGQCWCGPVEPSFDPFEDGHSVQAARIIGTAQNNKYFKEAFRCPAGSQMNPEERCHIWGTLPWFTFRSFVFSNEIISLIRICSFFFQMRSQSTCPICIFIQHLILCLIRAFLQQNQ